MYPRIFLGNVVSTEPVSVASDDVHFLKEIMQIWNTFFDLHIYIFKTKKTIAMYVNINVPGIQVKKGLNKEQRMVISENIC